MNLILRTPGRDEFGWITRDLERRLLKHGVDIRLGTEATADLVRELAPDGVIVATGAAPSRTGFSSVNPLVDELPGAGPGERAHRRGTSCSGRGRSASASSCSTTTAAARSPA